MPAKSGVFTFTDCSTKKTIGTAELKPAVAPLGGTLFLVGVQKPIGKEADKPIEGVPLVDAPDGGSLCQP